MESSHFEGLDPLSHIKEKRKGALDLRLEAHGAEISSSFSLFLESMKESGIVLLLLLSLLIFLELPFFKIVQIGAIFAIAFSLTQASRAAWKGWFKLERLHRLIDEERYEIEHHRSEEKEELRALYQTKGFEGELLDRIVDHLMAKPDRLLKVMLEEELGLVLDAYEHPIKQGIAGFLGAISSSIFILLFYYFFPSLGALIPGLLVLSICSLIVALIERNKKINALAWNIAIGALGFGTLIFLLNCS